MRTSRILASAVAVGGLYATGAMLSYRYLSVPGSGASFFPAAGITLAVLLSTPRRLWPYWLVAVAIAEVVVDLEHNHLTVFMALGFALGECRRAVRRREPRRQGLTTPRNAAQRVPPLVRDLCRHRGTVRRRPHRRPRHQHKRRARPALDRGRVVARRRVGCAGDRDPDPRVAAPRLLRQLRLVLRDRRPRGRGVRRHDGARALLARVVRLPRPSRSDPRRAARRSVGHRPCGRGRGNGCELGGRERTCRNAHRSPRPGRRARSTRSGSSR